MTYLLDVDGSTEACLLAVVALELDAVFFVSDAVGCDGRVVGDLLADEGGFAELVVPVT